MRISMTGLIIAGGLALGGCAYGSFGRYGGVSVGLGSGGYHDPWYGGYGYGYPYYGWYDGFYYPGTGFYVYDRYRRPYYWNDRYRRYWTERREAWKQRSGSDPTLQQAIWTAFERRRANRSVTTSSETRSLTQAVPSARTETRVRAERVEREQARSERAAARRARRVDRDDRP